ncbi:lasso RiPP family leader peptide-containing protein [Streptomyces sp. NPDC048106]
MNELVEQAEPYMPPVLVEVGEFSEDTLGLGDYEPDAFAPSYL